MLESAEINQLNVGFIALPSLIKRQNQASFQIDRLVLTVLFQGT